MHRAQYFLKAIALSIRIKSAPSMIVSCFGVLAAFLPMLISLCLASFTDKVQLLHLNLIPINKVLATFAVLVVLYVGQVVFSLLQNYYLKEDKARIKGYIKERIMRLGASVSYTRIGYLSIPAGKLFRTFSAPMQRPAASEKRIHFVVS